MKRTFTFLMSLFLVVGTMWAQVTSLEGFSQDKCYAFETNGRGAWAVDAEGTSLSSTTKLGIAVDVKDQKQQFAVLSANNGADFYLYSVGAKKLVKADGSLVAGLADAVAIADAGSGRVQFRFRDLEGKYINVDNSGNVLIDGWSTIDAGNSVLVTEAGDFNAAEAWAQLLEDCKAQAQELAEANAGNHAVAPALRQYTTDGYNAFVEAVNNVSTMEDVAAAITAFEMTKNLPLFTIDGGAKDYVVGKSVYDDNSGTLYFKETNTEDLTMLWKFDMTATEVGVTEKVVVRNAATGNLFWGADFIKVTETSENDGAGIADDNIFLFYTNGTGDPVHAQSNGSQVVRWGSKEADSGSAWKFTFVGISNPAAYDLSEVAAIFKEKAVTFAGLQENAALSALSAVQEKWAETMGVVEPLFGAVEEGALVLKADVEAAIEQMDAITAVVEFYSGDAFTAAIDKAWTALDELDEESDAYAALLAAKNVSTVTTVAELEAKIAEIDEIIAALEPEADPNDYTSYIVNADLSTADAWADGGTKGIKNGYVKVGSESPFDFCQTITLPAGQYKMTAKAAYRYGDSEQNEYNAIKAGTETHLVKFYAETSSYKYETDVMNRWEGASDTDLAGSGAVQVEGKYVPNSSDAVKAWFDADQYINEIVFNVQEEGEVKIGITRVGGIAGDYANIGAWTLTRLGDAEADPQPEEPEYTEEDYDLTEGTWSDATSYLVNADFTSIEGWTVAVDKVGESYGGTYYKLDTGTDPNTIEVYHTWSGDGNSTPLDVTKNFKFSQKVMLPAGIYRLKANGFYREGAQQNATTEKAWLFAGESTQNLVGIGTCGANDRPQAAAVFKNGGCLNEFEFTVAEDGEVEIGIEGYINTTLSWVILGPMTFEKKVTLKDNFMEQAMEYSTYGQSSMALYSLGAVQEKFAETQAVVEALYGAISADQKVLKVDVIAAMEQMTKTMAEIKPVVEYYDGKFTDTKWAMYDIQENSTPNSEEVATAFDEAVQAALIVSAVTTVAELEAKVAEMEAARQVYVMNAVPAEGYPFDMSFKIVNAAVTSADGWVNGSTADGQQYAGAPDNTYLDWCHWGGNLDTKDMYQELTGLPSGVYELKVATRAHADMSGVIYAGEFSAEIHHVGNTGNDLGGGWGWTVVEEIIVVDGKLTIGFKTETNGNGVWAGADNFQLNFVSELPEEVLLPLKKEAFLARYAKFEALTETLDFSWNAITENYYYTVQEAAFAVKEAIDEATVEILNEQLAAMDEAEEMLAKAYAAGAYHNVVAAAFENALGFATVVNQEVCAEAYAVWESKSGMMFGYSVATLEDLEVATAELLAAFFSYVSNATPAEGTMFDVTFLVQNPDFEKDVEGWTTVKTGWNGGDGFGGVAGIAEIADWNAGSWESSISQTLTGLPNGAYVVKAVWMAATGIEMTFSANEGETTVVGIGDTGGNVDKEGNVVDMGQGFRGWQYVEAEGSVEDGELTIAVSSSSTALHTWSNADAFKLYYGGYVAKDPTGIENIDAEVETVIFDLSGRRVQKMEKGIYIVNGKKVIVK